ncbi:MAG: InlB B-repeat-containing protein [Sphaerochaetaceae bacterium]|nr:InlB B-repeat-containing protein [Spirochaetales bacterium]MDY3769107.1 InlB B-repeat-containing protein [Sphaerochaetaceae bacterium]MDY5967873.1 InlB B-repeat-containing protein [Sphaerochaetaceae bacterium]
MKKNIFMLIIAVLFVFIACEPTSVDKLPHSIIYNLNGGTWTEEAPSTKASYNNRVMLPECDKIGYTLTGWKSDQVKIDGSTETGFSFVMPLHDVTLTPIWTANMNSVIYNLSNGSWPSSYTPIYRAHTNDTIIISCDPELVGSEFIKWQSYDAEISLTKDGWSFVMPPERASLTAVFSEKVFKISYILGDGAVWDGSYYVDYAVYGQNVQIASLPIRKGYTFTGWVSDDAELIHGTSWSFTMPGQDVSIKAEWSINSNSIKYNGTEGSDFDQSGYPASAFTGDVIVLPNLTKTDRNFAGWRITGAEVFIAEDERISFKMIGEDVTATALWKGDEYSITYTGTEGTEGSDKLPRDGYAGDLILLPKLEYDDHIFIRWEGNIPSGITPGVQDGTYTFEMPVFNVELAAYWEVIINYQGIENAAADGFLPLSAQVGSDVVLPSLSKTGFKFIGWFNGEEELERTETGWTFKQTDDNPCTVTAKWKTVYDVVYICYGNKITTDKVVEGEHYFVRGNLKPALENFAGWIDNNTPWHDDEKDLYLKNQEIIVNSNISFDAIYATPIVGRIFYDDGRDADNKNKYMFFKSDLTKIEYTYKWDDKYNCYKKLEEASYYWTSDKDRKKDRFYVYDTRRHDVNYNRSANYLYWIYDRFSEPAMKDDFSTKTGFDSNNNIRMGDGKYNTELLFGIIEKDKPIFYTDYIVGNSKYATEIHDSLNESVWVYVNYMNKEFDLSSDWYVGSYGEYKMLYDVLYNCKPDQIQYMFMDRDSHSNVRKVLTSSEAGKDDYGHVLFSMWDAYSKSWVQAGKNTDGQVIPLRAF